MTTGIRSPPGPGPPGVVTARPSTSSSGPPSATCGAPSRSWPIRQRRRPDRRPTCGLIGALPASPAGPRRGRGCCRSPAASSSTRSAATRPGPGPPHRWTWRACSIRRTTWRVSRTSSRSGCCSTASSPTAATRWSWTQVLGLSYDEAAEVCGCPLGTIRSRVARARSDMIAAARRDDLTG